MGLGVCVFCQSVCALGKEMCVRPRFVSVKMMSLVAPARAVGGRRVASLACCVSRRDNDFL